MLLGLAGQDEALLGFLLIDCVGKLDALDDELLASIPQLLVLTLEGLANFEQIEALLLPDGGHGGVIAL